MAQMREGCLVQRAEKRETSSHDDIMKTKDIMRKVEIIRRKRMFQQKINPVLDRSNVFEAKMRLLRKNNRSLAKALSEQKMAANHWYTETITLKGELQEAHEKLLRMPYTNSNIEHVFVEAEKQIKECYKSIDKDFNLALERIVEAVEKLTKAKQLVGNTLNIFQFPSQSPLSIFSRLPGSRTPLGTSGVGPPLQRAVLPMVSGHVLQPVMVPLPKLKIGSNSRRNNYLVQEDNDLDISTIEEQAPAESSDVGEEQQLQDIEEHQPETNIEESSPGNSDALETLSPSGHDRVTMEVRSERNTLRSRTRGRTEASAKLQTTKSIRRQGIPRRGTGKRGGRVEASRISMLSSEEDLQSLPEAEALVATPEEDDPLEGPSWLHDTGNLRGALRGRYRGRRKRSSTQKSVEKIDDVSTIHSSDQVEEVSAADLEKLRQVTVQESSPPGEAASTTPSPTDTQTQSSDHSCLDLNTSVLARLELLEAQGGRKSRRLRKSKLNIATFDSELQDSASDVNMQENEQLVIISPKKMLHTLPVSNAQDPGVSLTAENKKMPSENSPASSNDCREAQSADSNVTCGIVTNMDMTQPVSDTIIQQNRTSKVGNVECLQDECKTTQTKKKFFKTKEQDSVDEPPKAVERTPFDLSMLNESVVNLPPFSSMRTTEKENLQPLLCGSGDEPITLCDVSVVLKDVIKESRCSDTPKRSGRVSQKGNHSPKGTPLLSSAGRSKRARRTLQYKVCDCSEGSDEFTWSRKKVKKNELQLPTPAGISVRRSKKKSVKSLGNDLDDMHRKTEEAEITNARVLLDKTVNTEILPNCYVRIQRSSIMETPRTDEDESLGSLFGDPRVFPEQQQLLSKNHKGRSTEMRTSEEEENKADDCSNSPISREGEKSHIEENEKNDDIENGIGESGIKFSSDDQLQQHEKEPNNINEIYQTEEAQQEHEEEHNSPVNTSGFPTDGGCQRSEERTGTASPTVAGREMEDETSSRGSHEEITIIFEKSPETVIEENPRKRRAALKVISYKENSLHKKLRRENSSPSKTRGRGRGRGRGRSSSAKAVRDEMT